MAIVVASGSALSLVLNSTSSDQVSGTYQHTGRGQYTLIALASGTGMNVTCIVGGAILSNDQAIAYTGTAGGIDASANVIASQELAGGRSELTFRNTTGGTLTVDFILWYNPK